MLTDEQVRVEYRKWKASAGRSYMDESRAWQADTLACLVPDLLAEIERLRAENVAQDSTVAAFRDLEKRQDVEIAQLRQQYVEVCAEIERLREKLEHVAGQLRLEAAYARGEKETPGLSLLKLAECEGYIEGVNMAIVLLERAALVRTRWKAQNDDNS